MRYGILRHRDGKCGSTPNPREPLRDSRLGVLTYCPCHEVTDDIWQAFWLIHRAQDGQFPVAGGWLDQTAQFINAYRLVSDYEAETEQLIEDRKHGR